MKIPYFKSSIQLKLHESCRVTYYSLSRMIAETHLAPASEEVCQEELHLYKLECNC